MFRAGPQEIKREMTPPIEAGSAMIHQLRIYEIFEHNKAAFHDRFRDHASKIMKSYGFDIVGTWETRTGNRTEFVYLLAWPDEKTMLDAWAKFRADDEWKRINRSQMPSMATWSAKSKTAHWSRQHTIPRFMPTNHHKPFR